jgi:hypothetical protein
VGPQLEAARASLGGATKKRDTGAPVDLNSLGSRQIVAGSTVDTSLALPSSAGAPMQSNPGSGGSLQMLHGDATGAVSTTAGPATRVVPASSLEPDGASTSVPPRHAEAVIRGQINPAARACYENDPQSKSKPLARLVILIKLAASGDVDSVSVSSDNELSPSLTSCITTAAHAARFAAPGANGATLRAAIALPAQEDPTPLGAARAKKGKAAQSPLAGPTGK